MIWKSILLFLLVFVFNESQTSLFCQTAGSVRIWKGSGKEDGSVHALGNGKMLVYESGSKIFAIRQSPYSSPSLFELTLVDSAGVETGSGRESGTAIWTHEVFQRGRSLGTFVDFVDSELPCMIRHFNLTGKLRFHLKLMEYVEVITQHAQNQSGGEKGDMLLLVPKGTVFFEKYSYPEALYHQIRWKGNVKAEQMKDKKDEYVLTLNPGESQLEFIGGLEYPQTIINGEEIEKLSYSTLIERTRNWWKRFTAARYDFEHQLPSDLPMREKLLQTIDDVAVMLKTQQGQDGGVMAGHRYPMSYVRDEFGVARGLLALGYTGEAKSILDFYYNIWRKFGVIHNAQASGTPGIFHLAENDEVEITGYIILQAFDLLEKTGDDHFVSTIFPMLEWCWEVQKKHLVRGMLSFNGDETYVAGGFLPRYAINDGSSEATYLFIVGGEKLLQWIKKNHQWSRVKIQQEKNILLETRNLFRKNFLKEGQLITNNPERVNLTEIPRFHQGPCERRGPDCLVVNSKGVRSGAIWSERDQNNRYQCPACFALGPLPKIDPVSYHLMSPNLVPLYIPSTLLKPDELKPMIEKVYNQYAKTGILSCITDSIGVTGNKGTVGYDYGFLLYSMLETEMQNTEKVYRQTLSVTDSAGVWSEYYLKHVPYLTRYRPWESAVNIEALIRFAKQYHP